MERFNGGEANQHAIFDQPVGLFVLFFTEMWERFSYYGMRALLIIFLTSSFIKGGWGWSNEKAGFLFTFYTGLVYLTPIIGGIIADKISGYRKAIIIGALAMTIGHAFMALENENALYAGLVFLILGNGMFKPNISSMVGQLYKSPKDKDAGYTIFYMGINAGAFLGILLCGYIGEKVSWSLGFGLAGIFMFLGMLQFAFGQSIFGKIGKKQAPKESENTSPIITENEKKVEVDRLWVIAIFAIFTIFFWWAFEQAGSSMSIYARDYTQRALKGIDGDVFFYVDSIIFTLIPILLLSVVLIKLFKQTYQAIPVSNTILAISFIIIWILVIWKINREYHTEVKEIQASWFGVLNSFFIIILAPLFSKFWENNKTITAAVKFGSGLILLGLGFGLLSYATHNLPYGAKTASLSLFWLCGAYLLHTLGELCVSPVGLSYVSKLSPAKYVGIMFGFWFLSSFIANFLSGLTYSKIDPIRDAIGISGFFLIFTIIPILAGLILMLMSSYIENKMHGIS